MFTRTETSQRQTSVDNNMTDLKEKVEHSEIEHDNEHSTQIAAPGTLSYDDTIFMESFSLKEKRKIYWKTDLHLLPLLSLLYLFANLDR